VQLLKSGVEFANLPEHNVKQYYRGAAVEELVYDSHPFMELVPKDEKFRGKNAP
jgi:hypothetical protein